MIKILRFSDVRRYLPAFFVVIAILFVDQISKWALMELILKGETVPAIGFLSWLAVAPPRLGFAGIEILPFFNLVMVWNEGVSFGLFSGAGGSNDGALALSFVALALSVVLLVWLIREDDSVMRLALAMIIGGALGNVMDRLRFGAVADFFDFHLWGYHYPAFNIADCAVVLGVAYLVVSALWSFNKE